MIKANTRYLKISNNLYETIPQFGEIETRVNDDGTEFITIKLKLVEPAEITGTIDFKLTHFIKNRESEEKEELTEQVLGEYKNMHVLKTDGNTIYFTNIDLETAKNEKMKEINQICEHTIYNGIDIETSQGLKHFSLTDHDQTNLLSRALDVAKAQLGLVSSVDLKQGALFHADGEDPCFWSVEDFTKIENATTLFKDNQLAYCKALKNYVMSLQTKEEVNQVQYGMEIPELD